MHTSARRHLLTLGLRFTERELKTRFAGNIAGWAWALVAPLLLLGIYALVFGQVFRPRASDLGTDSYLLFVAIALWPWLMFSDGVTRGMMAIQANGSLVKKIAFPQILLVLAAVSAAFVQHLAGYAAVLVVLAVSGAGGTALNWAGLPVVLGYLVILFVLTLGVAAFLASLQTLLRDVEQVVNAAMMMLHYLTPVLYPLSMIPVEYRHYFAWNPLAHIVARIRESLLVGPQVYAGDLAAMAVAAAACLVGYLMFQRLSPYFEDFL